MSVKFSDYPAVEELLCEHCGEIECICSKLTFPTIAQQVLAERVAGKTTKDRSIARLARKRKNVQIVKSFTGGRIEYVFDDDTAIITHGRGKSYRIEERLP